MGTEEERYRGIEANEKTDIEKDGKCIVICYLKMIAFMFIGLSLPFFYSAFTRRYEIEKDLKEDIDFLYKVAD
jgi:hypothetical protein